MNTMIITIHSVKTAEKHVFLEWRAINQGAVINTSDGAMALCFIAIQIDYCFNMKFEIKEVKIMLQIPFKLLKETKTCYRFEHKDKDNFTTLYLKKDQIDKAGINPQNGIVVTIEEDKQ